MNEFILFIFKQSIYQITTSYIRTVCIKTTRLGQKNKKMEIKCKKCSSNVETVKGQIGKPHLLILSVVRDIS